MTDRSRIMLVVRDETVVEVDGEPVRVSSPGKVLWPERGWTKMDLVEHYVSCGEGALRGVYGRPTVLKRWNHGVAGDPFFQKRAPHDPGREYARIEFPSGRSAELLVPRCGADVLWMAQLNCLDLNPWPVRAEHIDAPDELRIDLDPGPGVGFDAVRRVALAAREVLDEHGLTGWPKTSGSRGIHVYARIAPEWTFTAVRPRRPGAGAGGGAPAARRRDQRVVEGGAPRGVPRLQPERARPHVASAYSVRPTGLVSAPLRWDEVAGVELGDFPMVGFADRYAQSGDLTEGIDEAEGHLDGLLDLARRDREQGLGDAPWPPHFPKQNGEPPRVQPSRRRMP